MVAWPFVCCLNPHVSFKKSSPFLVKLYPFPPSPNDCRKRLKVALARTPVPSGGGLHEVLQAQLLPNPSAQLACDSKAPGQNINSHYIYILHHNVYIYIYTNTHMYTQFVYIHNVFVCIVHMYVCMYVCMYLSIYLSIYVSMYLCIYVSMYLCIYLSMYVCMYVCMYVFIYVSMDLCIYIYMLFQFQAGVVHLGFRCFSRFSRNQLSRCQFNFISMYLQQLFNCQ